jgi:uncharacterized protein
MNFKKIVTFILYTIPVLLLIAYWVVNNVLPYSAIKPMRSNPAHQQWRLPQGAEPKDYGLNANVLDVTSFDNLMLKGWFFKAEIRPDYKPLTLIYLHGIGGCKEHFLPAAQGMVSQGFNVLTFDLRAHGQSGGDYCTFGFKEKQDISTYIDTLLKIDSTQIIGIMGNSLGGAIALQALAHDKRLKFGVIESTFNELEKVVVEYGADYMFIKSPWLAHKTLEKSAKIADFDPFSVKPCESAKSITQPVFMAHGESDNKIPIEFGLENFKNLASKDKEWVSIPNAGHINIGIIGGVEYYKKMWAFLNKQRQKLVI